MATKKSIWILIGIVVIMGWILGSATQAGAQTHTLKCRETGQLAKFHAIEVGDVPEHIIAVTELAGVQSCDDGGIATASNKVMIEFTKGTGKAQFYWLAIFEDGSTLSNKGQNTVTANPDGKTARWEGTFEYVKGTGRFEGIKGGGTFTGKRFAPLPGIGAQYYYDSIGTYTLPSK